MPYVNGYPEHNFAVFARDARDTLTPNATQRTTLIVAACYIVAIAILWCVLLLTVEDGLGRVFMCDWHASCACAGICRMCRS